MSTIHTPAQPATPDRPPTEVQPPSGGWTAAQRLAILAEYESYPKGDPRRGALLRRHGLYTSPMSKWRAQRARGARTSQPPPMVGRPAVPRDPQQEEIARLQRENARLQADLEQAQFVIAIQKKLRRCLGWRR